MALLKSEVNMSTTTAMTLAIREPIPAEGTRYDRLSDWLEHTHQVMTAAFAKLQEKSTDMLSTDYDLTLVEFNYALEAFKAARCQLIKLGDEERAKAIDGLVVGFAGAGVEEMED